MRRGWVVMPFVDLWDEYTRDAANDCLALVGSPRILLINNGSRKEEREKAEKWTLAGGHEHVLLWNHTPALPALGATWNAALEFCWEAGAEEALVVNNDVRLDRMTYALLLGGMYDPIVGPHFFVSAVGVHQEDWDALEVRPDQAGRIPPVDYSQHGGPDFSCFLISKTCHKRYPFDSNLTYGGDIDYHRRMMLEGDGAKIFSVNVPYLHFGSRTIHRSPEALEAHYRTRRQHDDYYARKWGGGCNEEKWLVPGAEVQGLVEGTCTTTSALFAHGCGGVHEAQD